MDPKSSGPPRGQWTAGHVVAAAFIVVFTAVQIGVPAARLVGHRGQRYGWQMFATSGPDAIVVGRPRSGALDTLDVSRYFAFRRGDLTPSYLDRLPAHICRVSNKFEWVAIRKLDGSTISSATCP